MSTPARDQQLPFFSVQPDTLEVVSAEEAHTLIDAAENWPKRILLKLIGHSGARERDPSHHGLGRRCPGCPYRPVKTFRRPDRHHPLTE